MLSAPCTHEDYNHLMVLFCKTFKRLVVDVYFYRKHYRFHGCTVSSSHANSLSWFGNGVGSCFLLHKKRRKKMRGVAMVTCFSSTKHCGKYSQCPAFDIKQSPAGRSSEDHQVCAHTYPFNKAQLMLPLSVLVCSSLNVCCNIHS